MHIPNLPEPATKSPPPATKLQQQTGGRISGLLYGFFEMLVPTEKDCCSVRVQLRSGSEGEWGKEILPVINFHFVRRETVSSVYTDAQTVANSFTG